MKTNKNTYNYTPNIKLETPNIKHIGEVPQTYSEYRKLLIYIANRDNHICYYCGKNHRKTTNFGLSGVFTICFDFLDDSCINLRDENLIVVCVDQKQCAKRIAKKHATPTPRV